MRDPVVALYVLSAVIVCGAWWTAARRFGSRYAFVTGWCLSLLACVAVIVQPAYSVWFPASRQNWRFTAVAVAITAAVAGASIVVSPAVAAARARRLGPPGLFFRVTLALMATVLPLALVEGLAFTAVKQRWLQPYVPLETRLGVETEDWRFTHITQDDLREPDPVLMWRPVPRAPYNEARFRGRLPAEPGDPSLVQIFTYGDSNTDGPAEVEGWPGELDSLLNESPPDDSVRYHVVNAGVAGYSSYQGLRRFQQEAERYRPDIVLVSFGWNDVANGIGHPDDELVAHVDADLMDPMRVWLRRILFQYRAFSVSVRYLAPAPEIRAESATLVPRVGVDAYASNLAGFVQTAARVGASVVLLTRPHRETPETLREDATWRRRVPDYNDRLRVLAADRGVAMFDIEAAFRGHPEAFVDESHFTLEGHRRAAAFIREHLVSERLLQRP